MGVNVKYSDAYKYNKTQFDAINNMWIVFEFLPGKIFLFLIFQKPAIYP